MSSALKSTYVEAVQRIERLHRRLIDLVKVEFDRMGWDDITPAQALMMFNMGGEEMTAGELISRGCYSGTNVSYNLKQLVAGGYIIQQQATGDRRQQRVRLTGKGEEVAEVVDELFDAHLQNDPPAIEQIGIAFAELDRFWALQANMIGRRA